MATYSSAQAYVSTQRLSRTSLTAVGTTAEQIIYTVPAQREAVIEIQRLYWANGAANTQFKLGFSGGGSQALIPQSTSGEYLPTLSAYPSNFPMKFTLAAGETVVFQPASTLAQYNYNILIKEFVAA